MDEERAEEIPETQRAVELYGADKLRLNESKPVLRPGPHRYLCRVEAVGLCWSDMKLLSQFTAHVRKGPVREGLPPEVLAEIPSYVPDEAPTVPGHEAVVRIAAAGERTGAFRIGGRYIVQADYRPLRTAGGNAAFGYNFEGALQEYVLLDERVIKDAAGEEYLLPFTEKLSAAAGVLVEPWACVESSYAVVNRRGPRPGGRVLIFIEPEAATTADLSGVEWSAAAEIVLCGEVEAKAVLPADKTTTVAADADEVPGREPFDDVVYFGARPERAAALFAAAAGGGLLNFVLCGRRFGAPVNIPLGRLHYDGLRICGTTANRAAEGYAAIPEKTNLPQSAGGVTVIGAGGPMGTMHVLRMLSLGVAGMEVTASDVDAVRLRALAEKATGATRGGETKLRLHDATIGENLPPADYTVLAVPSPTLAAAAVERAATGGTINLFAGIPLSVSGELNLDRVVAERLHLFGTSGSRPADMRAVLRRLETGELDTTRAMSAVSGMQGALRGLELVRARGVPGKILVYPALRHTGLTTFDELPEKFPAVAEKLRAAGGSWRKEVEAEFLRTAE